MDYCNPKSINVHIASGTAPGIKIDPKWLKSAGRIDELGYR